MSLAVSLNEQIIATLSGVTAFGNAQFQVNDTSLGAILLSSGTGVDKADQLYVDRATLAASGTKTYSMAAFGGAVDALGNAFALVKLKLMLMRMRGSLNCNKLVFSSVQAAGTGYAINDLLVSAGGTGTAAKWTVATVGGGGTVLTVTPAAYQGFTGGSFTVNPTLAANAVTTSGAGTGCTLNLTASAYAEGSQVFIDTDYLTLGGAAANPWTGFIQTGATVARLYSGTLTNPNKFQIENWGAGYAITAGASEQWKVVNSGANPVTYDFLVVGATA
jgi:hypothetical protein